MRVLLLTFAKRMYTIQSDTYLKVGSHYERLFQRVGQRLKSLINEPKRRRNYVREKDIFHSHYERFISGAIQLLRTFPSV